MTLKLEEQLKAEGYEKYEEDDIPFMIKKTETHIIAYQRVGKIDDKIYYFEQYVFRRKGEKQ